MIYEEFLSYIQAQVSKILDTNEKVIIRKVLKNNGVELDALTVMSKVNNISPTIYLNSYYKEYENGRSMDDIVSEICELYCEHKKVIDFDVEIFKSFDKVKDKVAYKVVNAKSNDKLLQDIPYIPMLDLAIVFYCLMDNEYLGGATALIHNAHMDMWGINVKELFEVAKMNTPKILIYDIRDMNDVIRELLVTDIQNKIFENDDSYDENCSSKTAENVADGLLKNINATKEAIKMYVLTNRQKLNGAACMFYDDVLKDFANSIDSDLYILPSSIHEVILIPASEELDEKELTNLVKEVNKEELDLGDILSDHTYYYNRKKDKITY